MPDSLVQDIKQLEALAGVIEPEAPLRKTLLEKVNNYTETFLEGIHDRPAYIPNDDMGKGLYDSPITEQGIDIESILKLYGDNVERQGLSTVSGKFMGYIAPCSMYYSALGDYIAAITDPYCADFSNCPGGARMEHMLLSWMAGLVGYPDTALGSLASGGSVATLTAIVTAREAHMLKCEDFGRAVVYATELTHHCFEKALHIAGMGQCTTRLIAMDEQYKMDPQALARTVDEDREEGLIPWMVVGSTGTTDLGSVDPLDAIADVAAAQNLWFHVDGAYGGFFILTDEAKHLFKGIERSDSVVLNPHKALYTPFGIGGLIVRNGELLYKAHYYTAGYLQDSYVEQEIVSPADVGPELSRHFRALRLWLPLKLIGVAPFRAALSEKLLLTRYFYEKLQGEPGYELGPYPELSVFAFRYVPESGSPDAFNKRIIEALREDGRVFLSSTTLSGNYMIRVNVLSYRTHLETIDLTLAVLREIIAGLRAVES
jgi:glutamate/tyrosine decarboxylase-like PLP-dependent enzyme